MVKEITRLPTPEEEELEKKRAELSALEGELADRELELATLLSDLHRFERLYLSLLGPLYAELDELRAELAELDAKDSPEDTAADEAARVARERANESSAASTSDEERARPVPSDNLKRLFREVAKRVHPDLAKDERDGDRRTRAMAAANRAFEDADEPRLRSILREFEASPDAILGEHIAAQLVRTIRTISRVRSRLHEIDAQAAAISASPLFVLKTKVDEAEREGRHLLREMAVVVQEDIRRLMVQSQRSPK